MPATQRGQAYKIGKGKWGLRYYDRDGIRRRKSPFPSKSVALDYYRDVIEPELRGETPTVRYTLSEFAPVFLERHAATGVRPRTIRVLRDRLGYATKKFGNVPLTDLERMSGELASWRGTLPEGSRFGIMAALRQALEAAVRWGYIAQNPAKLAGPNPQPSPRTIRVFGVDVLELISVELSAMYRSLPTFAAATGLRPEEWSALERRDIDRGRRVLSVQRTVSEIEDQRRAVVDLGKTDRSRRQVPLSRRALQALDELAPRLDTPLLFPAPGGGLMNLDNFRRREWDPAIAATGVRRPARIYDLRSTFASRAIAADIGSFELAKVMGTSIKMIERHYGSLLDGASASIAGRLDAFDDQQDRAAEDG